MDFCADEDNPNRFDCSNWADVPIVKEEKKEESHRLIYFNGKLVEFVGPDFEWFKGPDGKWYHLVIQETPRPKE